MYKVQSASICAVSGTDKQSLDESESKKAKQPMHSPDSSVVKESAESLSGGDKHYESSQRSNERTGKASSGEANEKPKEEVDQIDWKNLTRVGAGSDIIFDTSPRPAEFEEVATDDHIDAFHGLENFAPDPHRNIDDDDDFARTAREIEPLQAEKELQIWHKLPRRLAWAAQKGFARRLAQTSRSSHNRDIEDDDADKNDNDFDHTKQQVFVESPRPSSDGCASQQFAYQGRLPDRRFVFGAELAFVVVLAAAGTARLRTDIEVPQWQRKLIGRAANDYGEESDQDEKREKASSEAHPDDGNLLSSKGDPDSLKKTSNLKTPQRGKILIKRSDSLSSIAESAFHDGNVAWLIADINKSATKESYLEGKRIVEIKIRQQIELPTWDEVAVFNRRKTRLMTSDNLVTIIVATAVDRELLDAELGAIVGSKKTARQRKKGQFKPISIPEALLVSIRAGSLKRSALSLRRFKQELA